jgi:hypothetical protein
MGSGKKGRVRKERRVEEGGVECWEEERKGVSERGKEEWRKGEFCGGRRKERE